jgi:hypothetical protein
MPLLFPPLGDVSCDVNDICARFDQALGPAVRVWVYFYLLGKYICAPCDHVVHFLVPSAP